MKGELVGGVRISPNVVQTAKQVITPENTKMWENAKNAYKRDGNLVAVLARCDMSDENQLKLMEECQSENVEGAANG